MAPHGRFLQHRSQTTRRLTGGCECIKHTLPPLTKMCWSIFWQVCPSFFLAEISELVLRSAAGRRPWRAVPGRLSYNHRPFLGWVISIVPEMDGNILHHLLATREGTGRRFFCFLWSLGLPADLLLGLS